MAKNKATKQTTSAPKGPLAVLTQQTTQAAASTVKGFTASEKQHADAIVSAVHESNKVHGSLYLAVVGAFAAGCTFEGMELANASLKADADVYGTYRPIKSTIKAAKAAGISLTNENGEFRSKGELAKLTQAKNPKKRGARPPEGEDASTATKTATVDQPQRILDKAELCKLALGTLADDKALRAEFAEQVRAVYTLIRQDELVAESAAKKAAKQSAAKEPVAA